MTDITLAEAKSLYASTGFCEHIFVDTSEPPNCGIKIVNCIVCAQELDRVYC